MRECNDKSWPQFPSLTLKINSPSLSWQQLVVTRPKPRPIRGQYQRPVTNQRPGQQLVVGTLQHQPRSSLTGPGACLAVILHDKMVNTNYLKSQFKHSFWKYFLRFFAKPEVLDTMLSILFFSPGPPLVPDPGRASVRGGGGCHTGGTRHQVIIDNDKVMDSDVHPGEGNEDRWEACKRGNQTTRE